MTDDPITDAPAIDRPLSGLPAEGLPADSVLDALAERQAGDLDWRRGRAFSLVYHPDDVALEDLLHEVGRRYLHENALNPFKYPSLVEMEAEVVATAAGLVGAPPKAGTMTSGGTESIFLAVHTAREHGRRARHGGVQGGGRLNIVTADTAHPAFAKACHYLDVEHRQVPVRSDLRADPAAMGDAADADTVLLVGSAPCYPFGVIDPIPEIAAAASERGVLCHVDACLGGWILPFWERLGEPVPPWDFRVPGVTSLSADTHKYGYTFKGASVVLYADADLVQHQWFLYEDWPGGLYGSVTMAGTRPAAPIAGAWAATRFLGLDGYLAKTDQVRRATQRIRAGIDSIDGIEVTGDPDLSVFQVAAVAALDSSSGRPPVSIDGVGDVMDDRGWNLDRQQGGLHLMVSPYHEHVADDLLADLADAVGEHGAGRGERIGYGGIAP